MLPHRIHLHGPWECSEPPGEPWRAEPAPIIPHSLPTTKTNYRRRFSWPRPADPHERVLLVIDGVLRPVRILLNDQALGVATEPWRPTEFDITPFLLPRNTLELQFHEAPYNPTYPTFFADKGVREGVYLRIESKTGRWRSERIVQVPAEPTDHANLLGEWESESNVEAITKVTYEGQLLTVFGFEAPAGRNVIEIPIGLHDWPRWNLRSRGMPHCVKLEVTISVENQVVHEASFETGFLREEALVLDGIVAEISPEQAYAPNLGYPPMLPVADWDIARSDTLLLDSFVAPNAFYSLMDRIGLRVIHRGSTIPDRSAIMSLLGMHPCVQAGKA